MANNYQRRKQAEQAKKPNKFNLVLILVCFLIFAGYQWVNQSKTEAVAEPAASQVEANKDASQSPAPKQD